MKKRLFSTFMALLMVCGLVMYIPDFGVVSYAAPKNMGYVWPVEGSDSVSQYWGYNDYGIFHYGLDITSWDGSERRIIATKSGTIWRKLTGCNNFCGLKEGKPCSSRGICKPNYDKDYIYNSYCNFGMGNGYIIHHDDGTWAEYGHMSGSSLPSDLTEGTHVSQGQYLGKMGAAGMASGPHLHFNLCGEAWVDNYFDIYQSKSFNPYDVVNGEDVGHIHSYTSTVTKQPTCTASGTRKYSCSCGDTYTEEIAKLGHDYKDTIVAPTMTEKGYTLHECSRSGCNDSYIDSYIAPPELGDDKWYHCDKLPSGITSADYTIEYNNRYEKVQESSPGADWKNEGISGEKWVDDGEPYSTLYDLPTSESRVLVWAFYYHYCGPNAGDYANWTQSGPYVHYDEVNPDYVDVVDVRKDDTEDFNYYVLNWKGTSNGAYCSSGTTCDGSWGTHGARSRYWYKNSTYQNKKKVTSYKFSKESGWTEAADTAATKTEIRFKAKEIPSYPVVTSEVSGRQFRLKWTKVPNAEKYGLAVYQSSKWRVKVQFKGNVTSYTSPKMKSGSYKMVVCAKVGGEWDISNLKSRAFTVTIK